MDQKRNRPGSDVDPSPEEIRAQMAQTRKNVARILGSLKNWLFEPQETSNKGAKKPMATKKAGTKSAASGSKGKKSSGTKASASGRSHSKAGSRKKSTSKRSGGPMTTKAKKVLGDALAGAAAGALTGAARAVAPKGGGAQKGGANE